MELKFKLNGLVGLLLGMSLLGCNNLSTEKAAREAEKEKDGFHLSISTKDGDVKIDASGKGNKKNGKDKGGFHLDISSDEGKTEFNGKDLEKTFDDFELNFDGSGKKLDAKTLRNMFPERIGWFKRTEYNLQNAMGLVSNAEVEYTKGNQKVAVIVMGGAIGNIAGSFNGVFENEFDIDDDNVRQKTGEWNGLKYVEGYNETENQAFMHMVLDNKVMVMVAAENMSEWNFKWWWKRIDWKKLEK